ncbi:hypothetical protein DOJK_00095 [Patescibacteria group bacterium]|nr:hypothetical protein DOJK_00095 [Patescibacteria group bacterium]
MIKQTIEYSSPLDTLIDLAKRLQIYETQHNMSSECFLINIIKASSDDIVFIEWSNDYRHYVALHNEIEQRLRHAA